MSEPVTVICNVSPCTVVHEISVPPFNLSLEEGSLISGAVLLVWAAGWGIRQVIRALSVDSVSNSESE